MAFEIGDDVAYEGSLGNRAGRVVAVLSDGAYDVRLEGLPEPVRTDEASLSRPYAEGGQIGSGVSIVTNTSGVAEEFAPLPTPESAILPASRPGIEPEPLGEPPAEPTSSTGA